MAIIQGLTPTLTFTVPNTVDLTEAKNMYITLSQDRTKLTKTGDKITVNAHSVSMYLTQAESLRFKEGEVLAEMNWTYADGSRGGTPKTPIEWDSNLLPEVLP